MNRNYLLRKYELRIKENRKRIAFSTICGLGIRIERIMNLARYAPNLKLELLRQFKKSVATE